MLALYTIARSNRNLPCGNLTKMALMLHNKMRNMYQVVKLDGEEYS